MDKMLSIAEEQGIVVHYHNFVSSFKGIYWVQPGLPPIIGLNKCLRRNIPLLRCIMAEELGHHFTTVGQCIPREFYHSTDRITICRKELKALRWAAKYLIPRIRLVAAVEMGIVTTWELADYFGVTEDMVRFRCGLADMVRAGM